LKAAKQTDLFMPLLFLLFDHHNLERDLPTDLTFEKKKIKIKNAVFFFNISEKIFHQIFLESLFK